MKLGSESQLYQGTGQLLHSTRQVFEKNPKPIQKRSQEQTLMLYWNSKNATQQIGAKSGLKTGTKVGPAKQIYGELPFRLPG